MSKLGKKLAANLSINTELLGDMTVAVIEGVIESEIEDADKYEAIKDIVNRYKELKGE